MLKVELVLHLFPINLFSKVHRLFYNDFFLSFLAIFLELK